MVENPLIASLKELATGGRNFACTVVPNDGHADVFTLKQGKETLTIGICDSRCSFSFKVDILIKTPWPTSGGAEGATLSLFGGVVLLLLIRREMGLTVGDVASWAQEREPAVFSIQDIVATFARVKRMIPAVIYEALLEMDEPIINTTGR